MKRHMQIFFAGVVIAVPFAITALVVVWIVGNLDKLVTWALELPEHFKALFVQSPDEPPAYARLIGIVVVLVAIYLAGLLTRWWGFRAILGLFEHTMRRLPVVKTIYDSMRDIMGLFGGDAKRMGQVVRVKLPNTDVFLLGIRTSTNESPVGGPGRVSVYVPMSYQLGGFTVWVPADTVVPIDMTVEQALKCAATANAGSSGQAQILVTPDQEKS